MMSNNKKEYKTIGDVVSEVVKDNLDRREFLYFVQKVRPILTDDALNTKIYNKNDEFFYKDVISDLYNEYKLFKGKNGNSETAYDAFEKKESGFWRKMGAIAAAIGIPLAAAGAVALYNNMKVGKPDPLNHYSEITHNQNVTGEITQNGTFQANDILYNGTIQSNNIDLSYSGLLKGNLNATLTSNLSATLDAVLDADLNANLDADLEQTQVVGNVSLYVENATINGTYNGTIHYSNSDVPENGTIELKNYTGTLNGTFNGTITGKVKGTVEGTVKGTVDGNVNGEVNGKVKGAINGTENGTINGSIKSTLNGSIDKIVMQGNLSGTVDYTLNSVEEVASTMLPYYGLLALVAGFGTYGVLSERDRKILGDFKSNLDVLTSLMVYNKLNGNDEKVDEILNAYKDDLHAIRELLKIGKYTPNGIVELLANTNKDIKELAGLLKVDENKVKEFVNLYVTKGSMKKFTVEELSKYDNIISFLVANYSKFKQLYLNLGPLEKQINEIHQELHKDSENKQGRGARDNKGDISSDKQNVATGTQPKQQKENNEDPMKFIDSIDDLVKDSDIDNNKNEGDKQWTK